MLVGESVLPLGHDEQCVADPEQVVQLGVTRL